MISRLDGEHLESCLSDCNGRDRVSLWAEGNGGYSLPPLVLVAQILQKGQKCCKATTTFGEVSGRESFSTNSLEIGWMFFSFQVSFKNML